jgi:hypothetical protein
MHIRRARYHQILGFISSIGANASMFGAAQANHDNIFDHFFTANGRIDHRHVVGTGLATPGAVAITGTIGGDAKIHITWANGDGTVPEKSATTGSPGSQPSDPGVHIQDICGIDTCMRPMPSRCGPATSTSSTTGGRR